MSDSINSPVNFSFNIGAQDKQGNDQTAQQDTAFCMAILGDFSGNRNRRAAESIENRAFKQIDSYDYDDILVSFNITLELALGKAGEVIQVPIKKYKDFHPDQLFTNVSAFSTLRDLRQRLQNASTFNAAANEIQGWLVPADEVESTETQLANEPVEQSLQASLDTVTAAITQDAIVKQMMANRVTVSLNPRKDEMLTAVDESISELMRAILHHADFQSIESSWQALHFMTKRIKSGKSIKLFLLDVSSDEMNQDLSNDDITQSGLYKVFCDSAYGDINWSLIVGDYKFAASVNDILLLSQLGYIAQQAGATFISSADDKLIGCESFSKTPSVNQWNYEVEKNVAEAWGLLRSSDVAKNISLALPSFMIREPYSSIANPIKSFKFEEMQMPVQHAEYLWANAAFLKAEQFARAFAKQGWDMQPGDAAKTEDLPMHSYEENGRTVVKPCAEIALSDTGAVIIQEQGIIPLWSIKNTDKIHSGEFYTLANN